MDKIISLLSNNTTTGVISAAVLILLIVVILLLLLWLRKSGSKTEKKAMNPDKINPQPVIGTPPPPEAYGLRLVDESGTVKILEKLPVSIGRDRQNEIVLKDTTVSARHARIYYDEAAGMVCIEDLDSLNGLYINGQPTRKNALQDGVKIMVGNITLTFQDTGYIHPGSN